MSNPFHLKGNVDRAARMTEDDTLRVKTALGELGHYKAPAYGMTPYPDEPMFDGIKSYQRGNKLRVDGVMKPHGETERSMKDQLIEHSGPYICLYCTRRHGGVYSPSVCWECWDLGYR